MISNFISQGFFDRLNFIILNLKESNLDSHLRFIVLPYFLLHLSKSKIFFIGGVVSVGEICNVRIVLVVRLFYV